MEIKESPPSSSFLKASKSVRYLSLDVLRGLTIALMVLVNTPGSWSSIYAPFRHAPWHGFTITDLVFPTFLFVVGNAMSFSMRKFRSGRNSAFLRKVFTRTFLIFAIGLFLSAFPFFHWENGSLVPDDLSGMRIMGVLQRIALCYLFASLIVRYLNIKTVAILSVGILLAYWGVMYYFGDPAAPFSMEGNAALKFDLLFFDPENLWGGFGFPFDPEGLLSTLPAIVNVIAGYFAGLFIQRSGNNIKTVVSLAVSGIVFVLLGELWDMVFPINKPIWTSSYVVLTIGWDLLLLSGLIFIIEVLSLKKWTYFFEVFGKNPLFIFVMSGIFVMLMNLIRIDGTSLKRTIYGNFYNSWLPDLDASLAFAVSYMLLMWLLGYVMDKNRIYIKV
ncbi:MAG TPA: DUF5009 domain-containing protein [Salinimicrobium sp.]|nr:DUF5009 domain-containing protein [Salinimicrobium sp.]